MKQTTIIAILLLLVVATSCKSPRTTPTTPHDDTMTVKGDEKQTLFNSMLDAYGSWDTFVARGSASLGSLSSSFELRMIKDNGIQISLRPILGIEVARLIIVENKVLIYDKINSRYIENNLGDFADILTVEPTIGNVQDILLGIPFILGSSSLDENDYKKLDIEIAGDEWIIQPRTKIKNLNYLFSMNREQTESLQISQEKTERKISCSYRDYLYDGRHMYPSALQITAQGNKHRYTLKLDFSTASWDSNITIQPLSNKGYTRTTISQILESML